MNEKEARSIIAMMRDLCAHELALHDAVEKVLDMEVFDKKRRSCDDIYVPPKGSLWKDIVPNHTQETAKNPSLNGNLSVAEASPASSEGGSKISPSRTLRKAKSPAIDPKDNIVHIDMSTCNPKKGIVGTVLRDSHGPLCDLCLKEAKAQRTEEILKVVDDWYYCSRKSGRGLGKDYELLLQKIRELQ